MSCCARQRHWPCYVLIYIDELAKLLENIGVSAKLFADDVKVYVNVLSGIDTCKIQAALDLIVHWAEMWQLQLSVAKCSILNVGLSPINTDYHITYMIRCLSAVINAAI